MVEPVNILNLNQGFDMGATIPRGVDMNIEGMSLEQLRDLQRQLQDQVYTDRGDLIPLFDKVLARIDDLETNTGGVSEVKLTDNISPVEGGGISNAANKKYIGTDQSADISKDPPLAGYAQFIEKYPEMEPFINPSNSTATFNLAQNAVLSNEADVLQNLKKYKEYDAEALGKQKEESVLGVVKELDKQKREKNQKFFDARDEKTKEFFEQLYTDDNYDFEKKLALAQFGLELAGGRSFKGKALPILSEAGQNLIKNLTSINRAKKASQKEKTLAAFESEMGAQLARYNAEVQADAELGVQTMEAVKAGLETRDKYLGMNAEAAKYDAEIQNKVMLNSQNASNDLIKKHVEQNFPDAQKVTVQYMDKRSGTLSKPRHGYYYPSGPQMGQIYVTPDPTYGEADQILYDSNEFVNYRRYAEEGAITIAQAGKMAGNDQFTVADMDKFYEKESAINTFAGALDTVATTRIAFKNFPELGGTTGLIVKNFQNFARIADVGWMYFTGGSTNPDSVNYSGADNKRFYIDQLLDDNLPPILVEKGGQLVEQSILNPDQKKSLQGFVNQSQVIIADDYERYAKAKEQGQNYVILGDGDRISMKDMDTIFGAQDFYNPEFDKVEVRTQALIYAIARSRKETGRLNKDDIERASVSLNIYGKSDLGIQSSLEVVQEEIQRSLENEIDLLYRQSFASVQNPDKGNYFITWLDSYVNRGYYLPDLDYLRRLVEDSDLVSDYVKNNARFRSRSDTSIMYPEGQEPGTSQFSTHDGTILEGTTP